MVLPMGMIMAVVVDSGVDGGALGSLRTKPETSQECCWSHWLKFSQHGILHPKQPENRPSMLEV